MTPIRAGWLKSVSTQFSSPKLIAHPVIIRTDGPVLLILAGGLLHVLHNPGTTHTSALLFKAALSILRLPGEKRGSANLRLSKQLSREQKFKHLSTQWHHCCRKCSHVERITQQCKGFIPGISCKIRFSYNKAFQFLKITHFKINERC